MDENKSVALIRVRPVSVLKVGPTAVATHLVRPDVETPRQQRALVLVAAVRAVFDRVASVRPVETAGSLRDGVPIATTKRFVATPWWQKPFENM